MKSFVPHILIIFLLLVSCINKENSASLNTTADEIEGTYSGYRSKRIGQQAATDSTKVLLKVSRLPSGKVEILQTSPNEFKYVVTMKDLGFSYNLGITEAACGAASIEGEGHFKGNRLYLLETLECTRNPGAAKTFTQLHAVRQ